MSLGEVQTSGDGVGSAGGPGWTGAPHLERVELRWTPHPLLPAPEAEVLAALLESEEGMRLLLEQHQRREERIRLAEEDPFHFRFELAHWKDADDLLEFWVRVLLLVFGGNRASKSEYAVTRAVETAVYYPKSILIVLRETEDSSRATVQKLVWKYLPPEVKALHRSRDAKGVFKVNYSVLGGFTENKLALPNGSEIHFANYKQDPGNYEGWEIGVKGWDGRRTKDGRLVFNIGFWADENCPLPWIQMLKFRIVSRGACGIWTFTAVDGLTPAMKDVLGTPRTVKVRRSELLPEKINVEGCPAGTMPYVQVPFLEESRVIYFHSILNPFGQAYEGIKKLCKGRPDSYTQIRAYGYARDTRGRAFPNFGEVNIIKAELAPAVGTNYMVADPAGRRPIAAIWARVAPGGNVYIYRDWPEAQRWGDWAETSKNADRLDGDRGPGQQPNGFGVEKYVEVWKRLEGVRDGGMRNADGGSEDGEGKSYPPPAVGGYDGKEEVFMRLIDPRAARNQHIAEKGGTCLQDQFAGLGLHFVAASGVDVEEGVLAINEWLDWDKERPLEAVNNAPKLYVAENCRQVIWALTNWTGNDGEKGACKDFVDCVRYLALEEPVYVRPGSMVATGGGSY